MESPKYSRFILFLFFSLPLLAEYRVYQYTVKSKYEVREEPSSFIVTSSLDPVSYVSYHGGDKSLEINLLRSWMCKGNTSQKDICPDPLSNIEDEREE